MQTMEQKTIMAKGTKIDRLATVAAEERIAQLESEIESRKAEISMLRAATRGKITAEEESEDNVREVGSSSSPDAGLEEFGSSLQNSFVNLVDLWERRLAKKNGSGAKANAAAATPMHHRQDKEEVVDVDSCPSIGSPPVLVYVASMDSDETSAASTDTDTTSSMTSSIISSPSRVGVFNDQLLLPRSAFRSFGSRNREHDSRRMHALERMVEERDAKIGMLEAAVSSNTEIIDKMKDAIVKLVNHMADEDATSSDEIYELKRALALRTSEGRTSGPCCDEDPCEAAAAVYTRGTKREALEDECARLKSVLTSLEDQPSDQENIIEFLRAEMVSLLASKRMAEAELGAELESRGAIISSLEDTTEELRAENVRLQIRSQMLEGERRAAEEEMTSLKIQMQHHFIENSHYGIL